MNALMISESAEVTTMFEMCSTLANAPNEKIIRTSAVLQFHSEGRSSGYTRRASTKLTTPRAIDAPSCTKASATMPPPIRNATITPIVRAAPIPTSMPEARSKRCIADTMPPNTPLTSDTATANPLMIIT